MIDWAVLQDSQQRGVYLQRSKEAISRLSACRLLAEGLLLAQAGEAVPASKLHSHPSLFPFRVELGNLALGPGEGLLRLEREALGSEYLRLARL